MGNLKTSETIRDIATRLAFKLTLLFVQNHSPCLVLSDRLVNFLMRSLFFVARHSIPTLINIFPKEYKGHANSVNNVNEFSNKDDNMTKESFVTRRLFNAVKPGQTTVEKSSLSLFLSLSLSPLDLIDIL